MKWTRNAIGIKQEYIKLIHFVILFKRWISVEFSYLIDFVYSIFQGSWKWNKLNQLK